MGSSQKYIIVKDRVEIYKDFTINLLNYIVDFYLDSETLSDDNDIKNHYNWCFNKVCDEFKKENIDFSKNTGLRNYFFDFFYHQFYKKETQEVSLAYYEKFWRNIFEIDNQKNKNIINTMIEIYNIFDTSINQEKNILEIV
jgi:hypothetical protein